MGNDLSARLIRVFLSELDERLNDFDADLAALEAATESDRAETVTRLFRGAHSLKGAAASVNASGIELACQQLEDSLAEVRDGKRDLDAALCEMLFSSAADLRKAGHQLAESAAPSAAPASRPEAAPDPPSAPVALRRAPARVHVRDNTLRVPVDTIDALLEQSGELLASHHRIADLVREVDEADSAVQRMHGAPAGSGRKRHREELSELHGSLERIVTMMQAERALLQRTATELDEAIRSIRLLPFGLACEGLERVVRDVAETTGKQARLEIGSAEIGIDRLAIDRLRDPLVQLVRNAIDHGIEAPAERARRGKPLEGVVRLSAQLKVRAFEVSVSDDGCGLDLVRLRERVRERGIELSDEDLPQAVFMPGISTATSVTSLSGRGVGLDVVRAEVEALSGAVTVRSSPTGTTFVLSLPLTITTYRVMLVGVGAHTFGLNLTSIDRVLRIEPGNVASVEGRQVLLLEDGVIPLVPLHAVIGAEPAAAGEAPGVALILRRNGSAVALAVDALIDEREIYLRSLGPRFRSLPLISGAAIAADGSIALILRTAMLVETALALRSGHIVPPQASGAPSKRVLLVDDSLTTRTLERSILEAAGYDVVTAADGAAAWALLAEQTVDLVVSDVDMPRMTGFALVEAIRASNALRELPIILVTARDNETDRRHGLDIGADAYIVKSSFRQEELLEAIGALT